MKKCPSCNHENAATEDFCVACGAELSASAPAASAATTPDPATATAAAPAPAQPATRTLQIGDQAWPLYDGKPFQIGHKDAGITLDLSLEDESVSSTPFVFTFEDGKLYASYPGDSEKPYSVVKAIKPGQKVEVEPGEMVMIGNVVGVIV